MRLKNKNILVTAAGQGIGHAAVMAMVAEGATVWATDVNPELLKGYAGVANVHTAVLDVMNKDDIQKQVALIPRIDALFNCAGVVHGGTILQATDKDWDFAFNLNARGQFWMIQAVLPKMLEQGGGSIINMASVCSSVRGLPNRFIYGASKAAVIGLTKSVAADFWPRAFAAMPFVQAPSIRLLCKTALTLKPILCRPAKTSLRVSRWGAWRRPMKLLPSWYFWPPMKPHLPRATPTWSMVA